MGLATELFRAQRGGYEANVSSRVATYDKNQAIYRCVYRGSNALKTFGGCIRCPENLKGYDCQHPVVLAKKRPRHICLVDGPPLKERAYEEGYFLCSGCKHRTTFELPPNPQWAAAITSAPRKQSTLARSVGSLMKAGFYPTVFAEPGTDLSNVFVPVIQRDRIFGGWTNWFTALQESMKGGPDVVLMCQDDVIYANDVRQMLERNWPSGGEIVSLYCSSMYQSEDSPFIEQIPARHGFYGALSLAIAAPTAERMLESVALQDYGRQVGIDGLLGKWARRQGIAVHLANPSLADHIGDTSTMWPNATNAGRRRSSSFIGEISVG